MKKNLSFIKFNLILNLIIFIFLFICIQNSSKKQRVNFYIAKTIPLPISFIIGTSFIAGSLSFPLVKISQIIDQSKNFHNESNN